MDFLLERYMSAHPDEDGPIDPDVVVDWGFAHALCRAPKPISPRERVKRRLSRHMGHRYIIDPQQREVRALHAVPYEKQTPDGPKHGFKYYPLFTTEAETIKTSFGLRRVWAYKRVEQIEQDRLSYNDNNVFGSKIEQMSFDFDKTMLDRKQPTEYPTTPPEDSED
jgi:hypothetical protein